MLGLYRDGDCFLFISSFLAGKEAKEAGGTYDGSPRAPFQRPTGAPPLSVDPAQEEGVDVSHQTEAEKYRTSDVPPSRYGRYLWAKFSFLAGFGTEMDYRRCGAGFRFSVSFWHWDRL